MILSENQKNLHPWDEFFGVQQLTPCREPVLPNVNERCKVTSIQKLLGHTNLNTTMTYARAFDQTVMLDYFRAVDVMKSQPDGAWFELDVAPIQG